MPPSLTTGTRIDHLERSTRTLHSQVGNVAAPASTTTRGIKESEAIREEFGQSLAKLASPEK